LLTFARLAIIGARWHRNMIILSSATVKANGLILRLAQIYASKTEFF
jgi:hypothetical protein